MQIPFHFKFYLNILQTHHNNPILSPLNKVYPFSPTTSLHTKNIPKMIMAANNRSHHFYSGIILQPKSSWNVVPETTEYSTVLYNRIFFIFFRIKIKSNNSSNKKGTVDYHHRSTQLILIGLICIQVVDFLFQLLCKKHCGVWGVWPRIYLVKENFLYLFCVFT